MPRLRHIQPLQNYARVKPAAMASRIGGKAARTLWLEQCGVPVPCAWVIDVKPFLALVRARLDRDLRPRALLELRDEQQRCEKAAKARARMLDSPLPKAVVREFERFWAEVEKLAPFGLAVRSSATAEDQESASMAGLAHTELGVFGAEALGSAVQKVWASALLPRGLAYLGGLGVRDVAMAVLIEPTICAEAAGVAFTSSCAGVPIGNGTGSEMIVNASFGLGIPVVEGAATPDVARVDRSSGRVIDYVCADKARALVATSAGVQEVEVESSRRLEPTLSEIQLAKLAELARSIEVHSGGTPFDLEFAVDRKAIWILQARPALPNTFPEGGTVETVWSRANIGESLPGPATPLTWSVASSFADGGFRRAFESLGCKVPRQARLVANVHGRFYLNLSEFMKIASQVPGLDPRTLIELGGGFGTSLLERQIEPPSLPSYLRLPSIALRVGLRQRRLAGEVDRFELGAERARRSMDEMDLSILPDDGLATTFRATRTLLHQSGVLMLSCASAALGSHIVLRVLLGQTTSGDAGALSRALASGIGDLESARPGVAVAHLAAAIGRDPAARDALLSGRADSPSDVPDGEGRRAFTAFLDEFGDRAVREVELMTPRWSECPRPIIAMLRASLTQPGTDPERVLWRAYRAYEDALTNLDRSVGIAFRPLVRTLAARARHFTRLRERMRTRVSRVLGMLRKIALEIDRRLLRAHPKAEPGAAFFCTFDELTEFLTGRDDDLVHVLRVRRAEHARDAARPDPPVTFVGYPPSGQLPPTDGGNVFTGLAASSGVVEASARVLHRGVHDADRLVTGEVLVVRTADVGLSPLFLIASAIVTEQGGPLSHAAIIAREYGVPAVVNVSGAMTAIHTGDRLRVDGDHGTVERLADPRGAQRVGT